MGALVFSPDSETVLLVQHRGIWGPDPFWTPPGGGVQFGESLHEALVRETREETGLQIQPSNLRYLLDFVRPPLHAVSHYFSAEIVGGTLKTGDDPEFDSSNQLILQSRFVPIKQLKELNVYPEILPAVLFDDIPVAFENTPRYLGTFR